MDDNVNQNHRKLAWSPNSNRILQAWGLMMTRIWNVKTGNGNDLGSGHIGPVLGLVFSKDGKSAVTLGGDDTLRNWDVATGLERQRRNLPKASQWGPFANRHQIIFRTKRHLRLWGIKDERELIQFGRFDFKKTRYYVYPGRCQLLVVQNNRAFNDLLAGSQPISAKLYDLKTGRESWPKFEEPWLRTPMPPAIRETLVCLAYARNSSRVVASIAVSYPNKLRRVGIEDIRYTLRCKQTNDDLSFVWETKETAATIRQVFFMPDDRAIVMFKTAFMPPSVSLIESTTGRERCSFGLPKASFWNQFAVKHAVSENGDLLAIATGDETRVYDIRRAKLIARRNGNQGRVCHVAFGSDSTMLFTGGSDGTGLLWDLQEPIHKAQSSIALSDADILRLWIQLADPHTVKAYRAVATMVNSPKNAVQFLHTHLKRVEKVSATKINKLIADLNSRNFQTRDSASRELLELGRQSTSVLLKSLKKTRSLEQQERIKMILTEIKKQFAIPNHDELRILRAVEVLEVIGTPSAQAVLMSLGKGANEASVTTEALAALHRLKNSPRHPTGTALPSR